MASHLVKHGVKFTCTLPLISLFRDVLQMYYVEVNQKGKFTS